MTEAVDPPAAVRAAIESEPPLSEARLVVRFKPVVDMTDEQFFQLCAINSELRFEREANGDIIIMTPEGSYSGPAHWSLMEQFASWARKDGTGELSGPAHAFTLPNTAIRGPDGSWILKNRF